MNWCSFVVEKGGVGLAKGGRVGHDGGMKAIRVMRKDVIGLKFGCPSCLQKIDVGREFFGEWTECPSCGQFLQVPHLKNIPGDFVSKRLPPDPKRLRAPVPPGPKEEDAEPEAPAE